MELYSKQEHERRQVNMEMAVMPLAALFSGRRARIVSVHGGRGVAEHLNNMGLGVGTEIEVLRQGAPGPFLVRIKETRLAIGQGVAGKIMVSVKGTTEE